MQLPPWSALPTLRRLLSRCAYVSNAVFWPFFARHIALQVPKPLAPRLEVRDESPSGQAANPSRAERRIGSRIEPRRGPRAPRLVPSRGPFAAIRHRHAGRWPAENQAQSRHPKEARFPSGLDSSGEHEPSGASTSPIARGIHLPAGLEWQPQCLEAGPESAHPRNLLSDNHLRRYVTLRQTHLRGVLATHIAGGRCELATTQHSAKRPWGERRTSIGAGWKRARVLQYTEWQDESRPTKK